MKAYVEMCSAIVPQWRVQALLSPQRNEERKKPKIMMAVLDVDFGYGKVSQTPLITKLRILQNSVRFSSSKRRDGPNASRGPGTRERGCLRALVLSSPYWICPPQATLVTSSHHSPPLPSRPLLSRPLPSPPVPSRPVPSPPLPLPSPHFTATFPPYALGAEPRGGSRNGQADTGRG